MNVIEIDILLQKRQHAIVYLCAMQSEKKKSNPVASSEIMCKLIRSN